MQVELNNITPTELIQASEIYPSLWVMQNNILNEAGLPIEFDNHAFLKDIFNDMSKLQVVLKAPQVGMTTTQVIKCLYLIKKTNKQVIYTLPTASDVYEMVGGSFNRIIAQNQILREWVQEGDTMEHKMIGDGQLRFRGTFSAKQAMMIPSDQNVHDEVDASDPEVISLMETRLQAKAGGGRWYFSHPQLGGFGVDKYWQQSNMREWFIKCNHCNKEQQLKWPENINLATRQYICTFCQQELTNECRKGGKWKATSKGIFSGYHISQLMCPWITADKICTDWESKTKQYFWNYVLGLPYAASEDMIDSTTVLKNVVEEVNEQEEPIIIGVDTGLPSYFLVGNKNGFFHYGSLGEATAGKDPYDMIRGFLKRWKKAVVVSDQGGDLTPMRKIQAEFPGRVFLCYYRRDTTGKNMIKWGQGDDYGIVTVDRNRMIQMIVEQLKELGRIQFNGTKEEWAEFADHFNNIYREWVVTPSNVGKDDTSLYGDKFVWKRTGADHYLHTLVYALVGLDKFSRMKATIMSPGILDEISKPRINNIMTPDDYAA